MDPILIERLEIFKEELATTGEKEIDSMKITEDTNAHISSDSKSYREGNKYVFKQKISDENAKEIIDLAINNDAAYNINEYKEKLRSVCGVIALSGESPVEMLIYATKGIKNEAYINCILDELSNLQNEDIYFLGAYKNILNNWTWSEQILIVLKSIKHLGLNSLKQEVFRVFEKNPTVRKEAANTLIALNEEEYFNSMINLLLALSADERGTKEMIRDIFINICQNTPNGSSVLYNIYIKANLSNEFKSIMIAAMRKNITPNIILAVEKKLKNSQESRVVHNKIIRFLSGTKRLNRCRELLFEAKKYNYIDQNEVNKAIGEDNAELQAEIVKNKNKSIMDRKNAIISLGKSTYTQKEVIIKEAMEDSVILSIVGNSTLAEMGDKKGLITIFKYLLSQKEKNDISQECIHQIKRLRGIRNTEISDALIKASAAAITKDENENRIMLILEIFSTGISDDRIGNMLLNKLKTTSFINVKKKIIELLTKDMVRFNKNIQNDIRSEIVKCSLDQDKFLSNIAMECLKKLNKTNDQIPV